jgi:hypothetical protein
MAEVLLKFAEPVLSAKRALYAAQASGAELGDGRWEAWIEFTPLDGGPPVQSPRETTQPNRLDTVYWASGLTGIYLEGALARALRGPVVTTTPPTEPLFDRPAADSARFEPRATEVEAVLDPFSVYEKGDALLRQELRALSAWHLVNIAMAYRLSDQPIAVLNQLPQSALVDLIVARVRDHTLTK